MPTMNDDNKLLRFVQWDGGTGCYTIASFPNPNELKDVPVDDILDFVDVVRSKHTNFQSEAGFQINRFWMDLSLNLRDRIIKNKVGLVEDLPIQISLKRGDKTEQITIVPNNKEENTEEVMACIAETIRANYNAID